MLFSRRFLRKLKKYVSNRAKLVGSIVEPYILKECINNWSLYIDGIKTMHNQMERNQNFGESSEELTVFSQTTRPTGVGGIKYYVTLYRSICESFSL